MVTTLKKGASKKSVRKILESLIKNSKTNGIDAYKYCGKINLKKDAVTIQKELRNEWG